MNSVNPNDSEKFVFIWIDRIHSDSVLMGLGLKNFFELDRNETVWFGYKFRNDSENFGLVRNELQSETIIRVKKN